MKKLYRSRKDRKIAGVCSGIGEYLGIDPTILRVIFLVCWAAVLYFLLCLVIPEEGK